MGTPGSGSGLYGRQRLLIGLAGVSRAASGGMLATALVVYVGRTGSPFAVGLLATAFFFSMMVFTPLWGVLGDLTGRRRAILIGLGALTTLAAGSFAVVESLGGLIAMRAVYAVFAVGFGPLMLSLVGAIAGPERRGRSAGFFSSALAAGDMGGQLLIGVVLGLFAPSGVYLLVAALSLGATAVVVLLEDPAPGAVDTVAVGTLIAGVRDRLLPSPAERRILAETGLTWLYAGLALRHAAVRGVGSLVPIYLVGRLGASEVTMGLLLTVGPAAQIGFMGVVGAYADTGDRRRLILFGLVASAVYLLILAAAALPASQPARLAVAAIAFLAVAAGFSALDIGVISVIGGTVPAHREGAFLGLRQTAAGVGGVIGPTVVGGLATVLGYAPAFGAASLLAAAAVVLVGATLVEPDRPAAHTATRTVETAVMIPRPGSVALTDDD